MDIRQALVQNPSIQENDQEVEASDCDVGDSVDADADADNAGARNNYASGLHINETSQDFYQSQVGKPRGRSIKHSEVQHH